MNFGELCQQVAVNTNRPDLLAETQQHVRKATLKFHMIDFWMRDQYERLITFSAFSSVFAIDIPTTFERWRKFGYIRPVDTSTNTPKNKFIKTTEPGNIFDEFSRLKTDVGYVAGNQFNVRTADSEAAFLCSWFQYPVVDVNNYGSWIADMYPDIIIDEATGRLLHIIGQVDEGNKFVDPQKGTVYHPETGHLHVLRINEIEPFAR